VVSDLAIARLAFAQSATGAEAQLRTAALRLEVAAAHTKGQSRAALGLNASAPVDTLVQHLAEAGQRLDKEV
jgi:hypothetical protein